ncbi:MAG: hypothetical protein RJA59_393, partial [Pseudomonadota bacterium]
MAPRDTRRTLLLAAVLAVGCTSAAPPAPLTFETSVPLSTDPMAPAVADAPVELLLTFPEPLDGTTVSSAIEFVSSQPGGAWIADPPVDVLWTAASPALVRVRTRDGRVLPSGHAYRLTVGAGIRAASGLAPAGARVGYLATDNPPPLSPLLLEAGSGADRRDIYVISDVHMGDRRSLSDTPDPHYGWFKANRDALQEFLERAGQTSTLRELVIAGDLLDEWVAPMELTAFGDAPTEAAFVQEIRVANEGVVGAFRALASRSDLRLTYVPGNHDMLADADDIAGLVPGIHQARDAKGLGRHSPDGHPEVVIEHGHRYDFFNAPAPLANPDVPGSILPPGYFVSKVASTSDREHRRKPGLASPYAGLDSGLGAQAGGEYLAYLGAWAAILIAKPIDSPGPDETIATGIDGFTTSYALAGIVPHFDQGQLDVDLYQHIEPKWSDRASANGVANPIDYRVAILNSAVNRLLDAQAAWQYFVPRDTGRRIVVFGHTHEVRLDHALDIDGVPCIYANSGTWIDAQ